MAILKSIKQKEKEFVFTSYENDKAEKPAKAVFSRFPLKDEIFPVGVTQSIMDNELLKKFDNSIGAKKELVNHIVNTMISNITANRIDYGKFLKECVEKFDNLQFDKDEIATVDDFLNLPEEAVQTIAQELYEYATMQDEFSFDIKKKLN